MSTSYRPSLYYYHHKKTKVKDLVGKMELQEEIKSRSSQKINSILNQRRQKLRQIRNLKNSALELGPFKPKKVREVFSTSSPISSQQKYLLEKYRTKIIQPNRASQSKPNFKGGSLDASKISCLIQNDHPDVISKRFSQFCRIVDQQTGIVKKKSLEKDKQRRKNMSSPNPMKINMKMTFFNRQKTNQIDFYKAPVSHISRISSWVERQNTRVSEDTYKTLDATALVRSRQLTQINETQRNIIKKSKKVKKMSRMKMKQSQTLNSKTIEQVCRQTHKYLDEN